MFFFGGLKNIYIYIYDSENWTLLGPSGPEIINFVIKNHKFNHKTKTFKQHI
jgi:hypothetical protein